MKRKAVSGIMLTLLLMGMLSIVLTQSLISVLVTPVHASMPLKLPLSVGEHAQAAFDVTKALPAGSVVISSFDFGPSTIVENKPQAKAHLFQCRERGLKVVALAFWVSGGPLGEEILEEVYGEDLHANPEYGTSIVYLGYVPGNEVGMQTFGDDTLSAKGTDHYGTPVADLPLMQEVRSAADFDLWAEWTSGTPGEQQVIQFVQGRHTGENPSWPQDTGYMPLVVGATAVSVPGMMPFWDAGQIVGILKGLEGAAEYEMLLMAEYGYEPTIPPSITILSPENATYATSSVPLDFSVTHFAVGESTSWIGYSLDGEANITITGNTTLSQLSNGLHNLLVYANNTAGNTGASEMVYFSIEAFPIEIVAVVGLIAVVGAVVLVYFFKFRK